MSIFILALWSCLYIFKPSRHVFQFSSLAVMSICILDLRYVYFCTSLVDMSIFCPSRNVYLYSCLIVMSTFCFLAHWSICILPYSSCLSVNFLSRHVYLYCSFVVMSNVCLLIRHIYMFCSLIVMPIYILALWSCLYVF